MSAIDVINNILYNNNLSTYQFKYCLVAKDKIPYTINNIMVKPNNVQDFCDLYDLVSCISLDDYVGVGISIQASNICAIDVDHCFEKPFDINTCDDRGKQIIELFKTEKLSRMPVYEETIDDIIGTLNIKDIIFLSDEEIENFDIKKYIRDPFFTYEFKKITQLLEEMKKDKSQMAIVVDEYGGTAGLITIEDLVEVIVGDIEDEYDEEEDEIQVINSNEFLVEGSTKISDVNEVLGIELESEEFDSIGGYIIGYIKHIPEENEVIEVDGIKFNIESVDKNRIKQIRILV